MWIHRAKRIAASGPVIALALAAAVQTAPAVGQGVPDLEPRREQARQYDACMRLTRKDPQAAHDSAVAWRGKGGGDAAVHCIAVSLVGLGQHSQAAHMLQELAGRTDGDRAPLKGALLAQAANAWIMSGRSAAAERLLTEAIALRPDDVELRIDRSIALAAQDRYWEALDDLNAALDQAPDRPDALVFRASAWRHLDAPDLARQDIDRALALRPDDPDALLERGLIRRVAGDEDGARADWLRVLEIAVEGPLTEIARHHLEALDVREDRPAR